MSQLLKASTLALCLSLVVALSHVTDARVSQSELQILCNQRTGLASRDFSDRRTRNEE